MNFSTLGGVVKPTTTIGVLLPTTLPSLSSTADSMALERWSSSTLMLPMVYPPRLSLKLELLRRRHCPSFDIVQVQAELCWYNSWTASALELASALRTQAGQSAPCRLLEPRVGLWRGRRTQSYRSYIMVRLWLPAIDR